MSSDINRVLVLDDRLSNITDQISYGVQKGAESITYTQFRSVSATPNQVNFNIAVPSQQTLIDRNVFIQATLTFEIAIPRVATGDANTLRKNLRFMYGKTAALAPMVFHQLIQTMNTTINNNTVTINTKELLPVLLRMMSPEQLAKYESTTPVLPDYIMDYNDLVDYNDYSIVKGAAAATEGTNYLVTDAITANGDSNANTATSYHENPLGTSIHFNGLKSRGTYPLLSVTKKTNDTSGEETYTIKVKVTEPLLMSPWIFRGLTQHNSQSFYGIANMNFQFTLDSNASRALRYANGVKAAYAVGADGNPDLTNCLKYKVKLTDVKDASLLFCMLTPPPSLLLSAKNIVPFYELPLYRTSIDVALPRTGFSSTDGSISRNIVTIYSNSIQLANIPDSLIIFVRRKQPTNWNTDSFLCINNISLQFDNHAGLLVNCPQESLWRISVENGLQMSWEEWSGYINGKRKPFETAAQINTVQNIKTVPVNGDAFTTYAAAGAQDPSRAYLEEIGCPAFSTYSGCGSCLVLEFGKDISLAEYYAPGSLGSFNLQLKLEIYNQSFREDFKAGDCELCIITKNSGILVNERGTTSIYLGLLTKQDVLSTSEQEPYKRSDIKRLIGGGWFDNLKSAFMNILPRLPSAVKSALSHYKDDHHLVKTAHDVLDHLGYGKHKSKGNTKSIDDHLL